MQKQAFYKQAHVWSGKVLTTLHIGQNSVSLLGRADTQTTIQHTHNCIYHCIVVAWQILDLLINSKSWHFSNHITVKQRGVTEQKLKRAGDHSVERLR